MKIMKRKAITAAQDIEKVYNGGFSNISGKAYKADYDMTISEDGEFKMTLECKSNDKKFMPEIKVNTVEEDGVYYFNADVKFPELKYDDMEFADSVSYWVKKWEDVADFITALSKFGYDPKEWEDVEGDE